MRMLEGNKAKKGRRDGKCGKVKFGGEFAPHLSHTASSDRGFARYVTIDFVRWRLSLKSYSN